MSYGMQIGVLKPTPSELYPNQAFLDHQIISSNPTTSRLRLDQDWGLVKKKVENAPGHNSSK